MARTIENLAGKKFNRLTVIQFAEEKSKGGKKYWVCKCDCGNLKVVRADSLKNGAIGSCGCFMREQVRKPKGERKNLIGERFGRLVVVAKVCSSDRGYVWKCICDCGKTKNVITNALNSKKTTSCGCYSIELSTERIKKVAEKNVGKNHYRYNESLTDEERNDKRDTKENVHWRKAVFARDDFTCVKCHDQKTHLNAHHLNSYATFPEQRFDTENGVTLCKKCHNDFHKKYTRFNNTKEQFIEFMGNTEIIE